MKQICKNRVDAIPFKHFFVCILLSNPLALLFIIKHQCQIFQNICKTEQANESLSPIFYEFTPFTRLFVDIKILSGTGSIS